MKPLAPRITHSLPATHPCLDSVETAPSQEAKRCVYQVATLLLALVVLAGCGGEAKDGKTPGTQGNAGTADSTSGKRIVLTDWMGSTVTLQGPAQRVISLGPNLTELVFALGAGDRLIGRTQYCNYPPEALRIEPMADMLTLNYEKIVARKPDLILMTHTGNQVSNYVKLRELGLQPFVVHDSTIAEVITSMQTIGKLLGVDETAHTMAAQLQRDVDSMRALTAGKPRVTAFIVIDRIPLITVSRGFISEMLETAGGENIAAGGLTAYPKYTREELLRRDPEVILLPAETFESRDELLALYPEWRNLRAVKNNRLYVIPRETILRPGPRIGEGLKVLHRALNGADPRALFEEAQKER